MPEFFKQWEEFISKKSSSAVHFPIKQDPWMDMRRVLIIYLVIYELEVTRIDFRILVPECSCE